MGALLAAGWSAGWEILLQRTLHTHLPGVDRLRIKFETVDELDYLIDRHTVAKHTRDEFGIVPVLRVELVRKTFDGGLVTALVDELEVVALGASLGISSLDDLALGH